VTVPELFGFRIGTNPLSTEGGDLPLTTSVSPYQQHHSSRTPRSVQANFSTIVLARLHEAANIGFVPLAAPKVPWMGDLPCDIYWGGKNTSCHFLLPTCILVSVVLTVMRNPFDCVRAQGCCMLPASGGKSMKVIRWGIIGCGNVTEVKSGPMHSGRARKAGRSGTSS